jgi:hypothetical protein
MTCSAPTSKLGRWITAIGVVGLVRLVPEVMQIGSTNNTYSQILIVDMGGALFAIMAGVALWREAGWSPSAAVSAGGALLMNSVVLFLLLGSEVWDHWKSGSRSLGQGKVLAPRLLFHAIMIGFWPYAFRVLIKAAEAAPTRLRNLWIWLAGSLVLSGAVAGIILLLHYR